MGMRAVVVVTGLGGLNLACSGLLGGACEDTVMGSSCWPDGRSCMIEGQESNCGLNGFECEDGKWRDIMTYCNPPPLPSPAEPEETPPVPPPPK